MWLGLRHGMPRDYVFASGVLHSVREVVEIAFGAVNLDWHRHVRQDPRLIRPAEPQRLVGDATRARTELGWSPVTSFGDLIREMTLAELAR
jgi:GDPmannose 4,6-dehydratase